MENNNETTLENSEPIKVLMADDDKEDQEIFQEAVTETKLPIDLSTVDNGKELMDTLHDPGQPNPDIIFLDINMPGKGGKECLEEIKNDDELKDIPTVMYTTSNDRDDIEHTFKAGANLYVPKPISFFSLTKIIKKIFSLTWSTLLSKPLKKDFVLTEKDV